MQEIRGQLLGWSQDSSAGACHAWTQTAPPYRAIRESADVLVCRLAGGKVTYVHRRLWPALVRLAGRFDGDRLAAIQEVHTTSGKHEVHTTAYPDWVPEDVRHAAEELTENEAASLLPLVPGKNSPQKRREGLR